MPESTTRPPRARSRRRRPAARGARSARRPGRSGLPSRSARGRSGTAPRRGRGASPSDGSSSSRSRGRSTNARASASICCSPPLSVPACCVRRSVSQGKYEKHALELGLDRAAARVGAETEVLPDGQLGERAAALRHVRDAEARGAVGAVRARASGRRTGCSPSAAPCPRPRAASSSCPRRWRRARRRSRPRRPRARSPCSTWTGP